jgi:FkbM family methyltransferase
MQTTSLPEELRIISNTVRDVPMTFMGYTRALALCARMNYETEVLDFIDAIPAGNVLYDLGACEGRFAMYAALRGIRCYAFEPEARNYEAMIRNIDHNRALNGNLIPVRLAVGAAHGASELKVAQPWAGGHQKVVASAPSRIDLDFNFTERQTIQVASLDQWIQETGNPVPDYLKVDVDGSELPFLDGTSSTLSNQKLKALIFELSERDPGYKTVVDTLQRHGFVMGTKHSIINEPQLYNIVFQRTA